jgi:hypothetical protein
MNKHTTSPIQNADGLILHQTEYQGIVQVEVTQLSAVTTLTWDRYMRLSRSAEKVLEYVSMFDVPSRRMRILDVGGFDGALAFFLHDACVVHLLDPLTTGGTGTAITAADASYDIVVSVDAIEHVVPDRRQAFLNELIRVARVAIVLNFPCASTAPAQELVHRLTGNPYIAEHVQYTLPDTSEIVDSLDKAGFSCAVISHTSIAVWIAHFTLASIDAEAGRKVGQYLKQDLQTAGGGLYKLIAGARQSAV